MNSLVGHRLTPQASFHLGPVDMTPAMLAGTPQRMFTQPWREMLEAHPGVLSRLAGMGHSQFASSHPKGNHLIVFYLSVVIQATEANRGNFVYKKNSTLKVIGVELR